MEIFNKAVERAAQERKNHHGEGVEGELVIRNRTEDLAHIKYDQTPIRRPDFLTAINGDRPDDELSPAEHAYNILRTKVLREMQRYNWNMLALTSPSKGNGKTTTAVNLAASIARSANHTVLLVDLNLHNPEIHTHFGVEPVHGVTEVVSGKVEFKDAVFNPGIARLTVLPGCEKLHHSSEFLCSEKMEQFVTEIRTRYPRRIVLFDMPPVLGGADVMSFLPFVQTSLLVLEAGRTSRSELHHAMKALEQSRIIGTVLNRGAAIIEQGY